MKLGLAVAMGALGLMLAGSAQAQLQFTLTSPVFNAVTGEYEVGGTLEYIDDGSGVTYNFDGSTLDITNAASSVDILGDLNFGDLGLPPLDNFTPGSFYNSDAILAFTTPNPFTMDIFGTYTVRDSTSGAAFSADFRLPAAAAVPEPGTVGLLVAGLLSGGLLVARRRK